MLSIIAVLASVSISSALNFTFSMFFFSVYYNGHIYWNEDVL